MRKACRWEYRLVSILTRRYFSTSSTATCSSSRPTDSSNGPMRKASSSAQSEWRKGFAHPKKNRPTKSFPVCIAPSWSFLVAQNSKTISPPSSSSERPKLRIPRRQLDGWKKHTQELLPCAFSPWFRNTSCVRPDRPRPKWHEGKRSPSQRPVLRSFRRQEAFLFYHCGRLQHAG